MNTILVSLVPVLYVIAVIVVIGYIIRVINNFKLWVKRLEDRIAVLEQKVDKKGKN